MPRRRTPRVRSLRSANQSLLRLQTTQVVDDVPGVGLRELALLALHVELRAGTVLDHQEDLAVGRPAIPLVVSEVRRVRPFGRHRAVPLGVGAVAEAAVLLKERLPRL